MDHCISTKQRLYQPLIHSLLGPLLMPSMFGIMAILTHYNSCSLVTQVLSHQRTLFLHLPIRRHTVSFTQQTQSYSQLVMTTSSLCPQLQPLLLIQAKFGPLKVPH